MAAVKKPASPEFLNQPLIPMTDFHKKLKAILSVTPAELEATMADKPLPPVKRGPKPKEK